MITDLYIEGKSFLHRYDPRPKLLSLVLFTIIFFLPFKPPVLACYCLALCICTGLSLGLRELALAVRSILPILILVILLTPPFTTTGEVLLRIGNRAFVTTGGLIETLRLVSRFVGVTLLFFLFFRTTETEEFVLALHWYGLPPQAALVITITVRYIPYLFSLYDQIKDAHRLRLPPQEEQGRGIGVRLGNMIPILVSVVIQAIRSIPNLAMSLESRGIGRKNPRSSYLSLKASQSLPFAFLASSLIAAFLVVPLFL